MIGESELMSENMSENGKKKKGINKKLIVLIGGVVAVCLGVFIYFSMFYASDSCITYELNGNTACVVDCEEDAKRVAIPSKIKREGKTYVVTEVGASAFYHCDKLTSIKLPDSVTTIGKQAFAHCYKLESVNIPKGVTKIEKQTFYECMNLKSIEIPSGVTKIGVEAFYCCEKLTSIKLPDGLTTIEDCAFWSCLGLTEVKIPASVTEIGEDIFIYCDNLEYIEYPGHLNGENLR